jgi:hypothetical protein
MNKTASFRFWIVVWLVWLLFSLSPALRGEDRFQFELYGGISFVNPKDLNLFSSAEQQYNDLYFIERLRSYDGYFVNDFPEIREAIPAGIRLRYHVSEKLAFSLAAEGFFQKKSKTFEGSFYYSSIASENHTKKYDPYELGLSGYAVLGGVHYRMPVGSKTDIEVAATAGWAKADFDFSSHWSYTASYQEPSISYSSVDAGILEGDGSGNGFMAQAMLRMNRMLGRRFGFFVETAYTHCRMTSIDGNGREIRTSIPGEKTWEGTWGIKREEIRLRWANADVSVPTNYWGGWTASQRERDFVLDLSGFRLILGVVFRL